MRKPYISVTGLTCVADVEKVGAYFDTARYTDIVSHRPVIGFLASQKTLEGTEKNPRYPAHSDFTELFDAVRKRAFVAIHYRTNDRDTLAEQVCQLLRYDNVYERGFCHLLQLNVSWPSVQELQKIKQEHKNLEIILQLSRRKVVEKHHDDMARYVAHYVGLVDHVLLDPSGGKGVETPASAFVPLYQKLQEHSPSISIGVAGGLFGDNVHARIGEFAQEFGTLAFSIDAEGKLRDKEDAEGNRDVLNLTKVAHFITEAKAGFS